MIKEPKGVGGRRPYDYVLMFKILILQRYYNLSDNQVEYQINIWMSFMRFLNLTLSDDIPDSKTVWNFRAQIINLDLVDSIFSIFITALERLNLIVNEGEIIDASFIEVPKKCNKREENKQIKKEKSEMILKKTRTKRHKKILMLDGQIKIMRIFTDTKIT
jgi:IS5 family transposase